MSKPRLGFGHGNMPKPGGASGGPFAVDLPLVTATAEPRTILTSLGGGGGGVSHPNEMVGAVAVTERFWNAQPEDGWSTGSDGNLAIVSSGYSGTPSIDPSAVGRITYPAGQTGGSSMSNTTTKTGLDVAAGIDRPQEMYLHFLIQYANNFHGHQSNTNKLWFPEPGMGTSSNCYLLAFGADSGSLSFRLNLQGSDSSVCGGNFVRVISANVGSGSITRGTWHEFEVYMKVNSFSASADTCDGVFKVWKDGSLTHDYSDVHWLDYPGSGNKPTSSGSWGWDRIELRPIWGGTGDTMPSESHIYMAYTYASLATAF